MLVVLDLPASLLDPDASAAQARYYRRHIREAPHILGLRTGPDHRPEEAALHLGRAGPLACV